MRASRLAGSPLIGVLALLGAGTLWGLIGVFGRMAFQEGLSVEEVAFYRGLIGSGALLTFAGFRGILAQDLPRLTAVAWRDLFLFSVLGVVGLSYSNLKAVETGGSGFAAIFLYLAPIWVAVWDRWLFQQTLTLGKLWSLAVTLGGIILVGSLGGGELRFSAEALMWGMISGFTYSLLYLFGKTYFIQYSPFLLNGVAFALSALTLAGVTVWKHGLIRLPGTPRGWFAVLGMGIVITFFANTLYAEGMKRVNATRASILCSIEPVVAIFAAWLIWDERMSVWGYAGAVMVIAGVVLSVVSAGDAAGTSRPRSK